MKKFDTRVYNISDFTEWDASDLLELSPQFQRRSVWSPSAKSYLIDTILRGKPIPKILMTQELSKSKTKRIIIDGQQRLRAILEFFKDEIEILPAHNRENANKTFSELDTTSQNDFLKYEIGVDVLFDLDYADTLDIFARLNTYSVKLNKQELLNAQYLGYFKQSAYRVGYRYVKYWIDSAVLNEKNVTRMSEATLASDLLVVAIDGVQSNKQIGKYYSSYEDDDFDSAKIEKKIDHVMSIIGEIYPAAELSQTNFKRIQLFYSLYCCIYHALYSVSNMKPSLRIKSIERKMAKVRNALDELSDRYDQEDKKDRIPEFIDASRRGTTDPKRRLDRAHIISEYLIARV